MMNNNKRRWILSQTNYSFRSCGTPLRPRNNCRAGTYKKRLVSTKNIYTEITLHKVRQNCQAQNFNQHLELWLLIQTEHEYVSSSLYYVYCDSPVWLKRSIFCKQYLIMRIRCGSGVLRRLIHGADVAVWQRDEYKTLLIFFRQVARVQQKIQLGSFKFTEYYFLGEKNSWNMLIIENSPFCFVKSQCRGNNENLEIQVIQVIIK